MVSSKWKNRLNKSLKAIPVFLFCLVSKGAFAQSANMPFAKSLSTFSDSILHQYLPAASTIMFIVTCLMLAFGEHGEGFKRILTIVMWLSLAFGVGSFINNMFQFA